MEKRTQHIIDTYPGMNIPASLWVDDRLLSNGSAVFGGDARYAVFYPRHAELSDTLLPQAVLKIEGMDDLETPCFQFTDATQQILLIGTVTTHH